MIDPTVITVCVLVPLQAAAPVVWSLVGNFGDPSPWAPELEVIELHGAGSGALRTVTGRAGRFVERCEAIDEANHSLSYSVVEAPWALRRYAARVRVVAIDAAHCQIEWSGSFEIDATNAERTRLGVDRMYRRFVGAIEKRLGLETNGR